MEIKDLPKVGTIIRTAEDVPYVIRAVEVKEHRRLDEESEFVIEIRASRPKLKNR